MVSNPWNIGGHDEDLELAQQAAAGRERANRLVAERLLHRVRSTVHYLAAGDRDADDLVQLALVAILRSTHTYRGECTLERWADRIAVRTALRELKRRRWRERIVSLDGDSGREGRITGDKDIQRRLLQERLARLLGRLSPDRRTAVTLHWMHGYSVQEIAELTDTKANTIRDRLRVAKKQLRSLLTRDPDLQEWARAFIEESHE